VAADASTISGLARVVTPPVPAKLACTTSGFSFPHDLLQSHMTTDPNTLLSRIESAQDSV
jgi:hypothetical protein